MKQKGPPGIAHHCSRHMRVEVGMLNRVRDAQASFWRRRGVGAAQTVQRGSAACVREQAASFRVAKA